MLRALIWPLAFAAMDDAGAAAFRAWPQIKSVSDIAATAIVTDHPWPLNLDSGAVRPYHDVLRSDDRIRTRQTRAAGSGGRARRAGTIINRAAHKKGIGSAVIGSKILESRSFTDPPPDAAGFSFNLRPPAGVV